MFVWLLQLGLLVVVVRGGKSCKMDLQQAIFKPKVCGYDYFKKFEKEIRLQSPLWFAQSSQECKKFGAQHAVGVHV